MIYELNYKFIEFVKQNNYCSEIMDKNIDKNRPYYCINIKVGPKEYLIPFRSTITHNAAYKIPGQDNGLDFTKSIPVVNKKIIKKKSDTTPPEYGEFLKKAYNDICAKFTQYIPNHHNTRFATSHTGLIEAQKNFEV